MRKVVFRIQHVSMLRLLHMLSVFKRPVYRVLGNTRGSASMILHDFDRTLCFHVHFLVVFGLIRYFLVKTQYFHVVFAWDHATVHLAV